MILVLFTYALWTSVFSLGKIALEYTSPIFFTAARMLFAGVLMTTFLLIWKRGSIKLSLKQLGSLAILGLFSVYLTNICEFWGLQHLSAAKTCFIYSLSPFFAALFSYLHFKEKMTKQKWLGLGIGFCGFIPVLLMQSGSESLFQISSFLSWPVLAIAGAALFSVYGWVLLRMLVKDNEISPITANAISMVIGGLLALAHSYFVDNWSPFPIAKNHLTTVASQIALITFISNIICYNLYGYLLRKYTATFLSFAGLLSPIFASLTGWAILGEKPSPVIFLSTGIVLTGLFIVYRTELRQGYVKKIYKRP